MSVTSSVKRGGSRLTQNPNGSQPINYQAISGETNSKVNIGIVEYILQGITDVTRLPKPGTSSRKPVSSLDEGKYYSYCVQPEPGCTSLTGDMKAAGTLTVIIVFRVTRDLILIRSLGCVCFWCSVTNDVGHGGAIAKPKTRLESDPRTVAPVRDMYLHGRAR